jgi:hypothetical protein
MDMDKRQEMTQELRRARGWILAVGIIMVVTDQIVFAVSIPSGADPAIVSHYRNLLFLIDGIVLAFFIGMWFLARKKPVLGCTLALVAFWGIQIYNASDDPSSLGKGILLKVLFTIALVKGIQSAKKAENLAAELGAVFE